MKKLLLAILMVAILVIAVPASAMAGPVQTQTAMSVNFSVQGINWVVNYYDATTVEETAYYTGYVTSASKNSNISNKTPITVIQNITYSGTWGLDLSGNTTFLPSSGSETGTIVINSTFDSSFNVNHISSDYAEIGINSNIGLNGIGSASDVGTWSTLQATGKFGVLEGAAGNWSAIISLATMSGPARATGNLN